MHLGLSVRRFASSLGEEPRREPFCPGHERAYGPRTRGFDRTYSTTASSLPCLGIAIPVLPSSSPGPRSRYPLGCSVEGEACFLRPRAYRGPRLPAQTSNGPLPAPRPAAGFPRRDSIFRTMGFWPETVDCELKKGPFPAFDRDSPFRFQDTIAVNGFWRWGLAILLMPWGEFLCFCCDRMAGLASRSRGPCGLEATTPRFHCERREPALRERQV
jgi:hypothetical protein